MKKLFILLGLTVVAATASAQFIQGPNYGTVIKTLPRDLTAGSTPFMVDGNAVTNFPITNTTLIPIGPNGVMISVIAGATNALTITNSSLVFGLVAPGTTNVSTTLRYVMHFPLNGTSRAVHMTNFSPIIYAANSSPLVNIGNAASMRLLSATNGNGAIETIYLTNVIWSTR